MPRQRNPHGTIHLEWHGDHWDHRFDVDDDRGGLTRSPRTCMPSPTRQRGETLEGAKFRAKEEARAEARQMHRDAWLLGAKLPKPEKQVPAAEGELMKDWIDRWLDERRERGLTTVDDDAGRWRKWLAPHLADRPVAAVQRIDLERIVEELDNKVRAGELSWKTAGHVFGMTKKMFSDACGSKRLSIRVREDNPAERVRGPDRGGDKAKSYLYPNEVTMLLACETVPIRWRRLFALMVYTYTRPGELAALRWEDVDFDRGTIHIHRALDKNGDEKPTKTKVTRRIPIEPSLRPLLEAMKAETKPAVEEFPGAETFARVIGSMPPESDLSKCLREYLQRAGVTRAELFANDATRKQIRLYDLRATGITFMALAGLEPQRIMQRAGHEEFETTLIYIREAETFGDVGVPFPPLPPSVLVARVEGPSFWGTFGKTGRLPSGAAGDSKSTAAAPVGILPRILPSETETLKNADKSCVPSGTRAIVPRLPFDEVA